MEQIYFSLCSQNNENAICDGQYWTSTQVDENDAVVTNMGNGISSASYKHNSYLIRPIRTFGNILMGCMDESACNYNSTANMVDTSCEYPEQGYDCDGNITAEIGDEMEGGYLFYIDESGEHGLVAAMEDLDSMEWWDALSAADGSTSQGYDDWSLPSIEELGLMYNTLGNVGSEGNIGGFETSDSPRYWSSLEDISNSNLAWCFGFNNGSTENHYKDNYFRVRCVRDF